MERIKNEPGLKFGIYAALIQCITFLILNAGGPESFISLWRYLPWLIMLGLAIAAGKAEQKLNDGKLVYSRALVIVFTVIVFGEFAAVLTEYSIYNFVNPTLSDEIKPIMIEKTREAMDLMGGFIQYAEGDFEENMKVVEEADYHFYLSNAIQKFLMLLSLNFIVALILAAIVKKENKVSERSN